MRDYFNPIFRPKGIGTLLLGCVLWSTPASAQFKNLHLGEDPSITESRLRIDAASQPIRKVVNQPGVDIRFMELHLTVDPTAETIGGQAIKRIHLGEPVSELMLQLTRQLDILHIRDIGGFDVPYRRNDDGQLILTPSGGFSQGDHTVTIAYQGKPASTWFGSFTFSSHLGVPFIWTLSQPNGAKDWFPTSNDPADKLDSLLMRITVPKPLTAVSNGLLISQEARGDQVTYVWRHRYPIAPYLISMAIADYEMFRLEYQPSDGEPLPIDNYILKGQNVTALTNDARQTLGLMDLFWRLYGPYPFRDEKYGHAQIGLPVSGMEHQTISSMGNLGFFLVAHELAHQWFGNKVTNATWSDLWIQEGMATLSEGLSLRYFLGEDDYRNWLRMRRENVLTESGGSVHVPASVIAEENWKRLFDFRLTYRKAAWVLHMLRAHVGDDDFFAGLRAFLETHAYASASTEDLRTIMERESGKSLDVFFRQWVYGEGHPVLSATYSPAAGAPGALRFNIQQVGSHVSVPTFDFPLEIRLASADRDTILTVFVSKGEESFLLEPGFSWSSLTLDPNVNLLFRQQVLTSLSEDGKDLPSSFTLEAGYPNPFNPSAYIPVRVERSGLLVVDVVDIQGRIVQVLLRAQVQPGPRRILWDATGLRSGVYFIRARMGSEIQTVKMTVLR